MTTYYTILIMATIAGIGIIFMAGSVYQTWITAITQVGNCVLWIALAQWAHGFDHIAVQTYAVVSLLIGGALYARGREAGYITAIVASAIAMAVAAIDVTLTASEIPVILWVFTVFSVACSVLAVKVPQALFPFSDEANII